jgi:hypothetical protein
MTVISFNVLCSSIRHSRLLLSMTPVVTKRIATGYHTAMSQMILLSIDSLKSRCRPFEND